MITRDRMEEIIRDLKSVEIEVTSQAAEVDQDYITSLLGKGDDYTQKFEDYIIEVAFAVTQLENEIADKKDLYDASFQEIMTSDEDVKKMGTGAERQSTAKYKLRDQTKEITRLEGELREVVTLKELLKRRISSIGSTITSGKKQYDARIDAIRRQFLGERDSTEIPGTRVQDDDRLVAKNALAEDESLAGLGEDNEENDNRQLEETKEGELSTDL